PAELITPAVWSRIIGILECESTLFKTKMIVRCKISQGVVFIAACAASLRNLACYLVISFRIKVRVACYGVEESKQSDRMLPTFVLCAYVGLCRQPLRNKAVIPNENQNPFCP
ncbi:hypothetical protein, partial [Pectobacterium sp. CFBP8739]|uniref:hypothetical protein n=1 Tax=Pectobacterium sp. CFBP8739 TaxID=2748908 RepID=UPI001C5D4629